MTRRALRWSLLLVFPIWLATWSIQGCWSLQSGEPGKPRMAMFVGIDVSGSFMRGKYYDDALDFLAYYIYSHLKGIGGLEIPKHLYVGSLGGNSLKEAKTFYPIQDFEDKSIDEIRVTLNTLFPKTKNNPLTDFNSFFEQVTATVRNKNLVLKPINIVLLSDGMPDFSGSYGSHNFRRIKMDQMEALSRNIAVRLLYTDAVTGQSWQNKIKRQRIRIWTQDAAVMQSWKEPKILIPGTPMDQQTKFLDWVKDNVDFNVRAKRVD
jgi:hypothetical protein